MPHYHFHLHECGEVTLDEDGQELPDADAARAHAIAAARDIMREEVRYGRLCMSCHIDVTDAAGGSALIVPFREAVEITGL